MAGDVVFGRGVDYTRYVRGMRVTGTTATGTIQARNVYLVELDWGGGRVEGACTCPHFADGHFCKHLVALGLCAIDNSQPRGVHDVSPPPAIVDLVAALQVDELRDMVIQLAERDGRVRRDLEVRHAASSGNLDHLADDLVALVHDALSVRGFIDYRRSFEVASDAQTMLDELERRLDQGLADAVRPALLKAVTRLRRMVEQADDSSGSMGDACQRAADLYARSCREGEPDPARLASWLVTFRAESPGWPDLELADFAEALGDDGIAAYRRAVGKLDAKHDDADRWDRFEIDRMLLELADHDGDVDRAVALLSRDESPAFGAIVSRLTAAGRNVEALDWIDRAVDAGRASGHPGGNHYALDPLWVANTYLEVERTDDALKVLGSVFSRFPGRSTFRQLMDVAARVGRADEMRGWALTVARGHASQPYADGAALVDIALDEGDLDAAWDAARQFGAGQQWEALAAASATSRPLDAAKLFRQRIDADLQAGANTKLYPGIARRLAALKELYARGGESATFDDYLATIRDSYSRRPSLMKALDSAGL